MKKILILITIMIIAFLPLLTFAQRQKIKHVIVIGVDGLGGSYMQPHTMPFTEQLMQEGSYTLQARCIRPSSSASNWASMLMGAGPELTGYTKWDSRKPEIPPAVLDQYGMFPSIYGLLKQQKPKTIAGPSIPGKASGIYFQRSRCYRRLCFGRQPYRSAQYPLH